MAKLLKKFKISNGDILALRFQSPEANRESIDQIVHALEQLGINALVVVVEDFDDLTVLNETEMGKRGWFRLDKFSKVIRPKEQVND